MIGIDPGATMGWARFVDGVLWDAGFCKREEMHLPPVPFLPAILVVEKPVFYPEKKHRRPNDLITLALLAGQVAGAMVQSSPGLRQDFVRPRTWKGAVPKEITNARTLDALTPDELAKLPRRPRAKNFDHNMLDAVGIGLWQLQREAQRR